MKYTTLLYLLAAVCLFTSCQKDSQPKPDTQAAKPDPETLLTDSASFTINGQSYVFNSASLSRIQNIAANRKVDSVNKGSIYISATNKDSVLFSRTYGLSGTNNNHIFELTFLKKYSTNQLTASGGLLIPKDLLDLFKPGAYIFATDFLRENAHNGVAIDISRIGSSYSYQSILVKTSITQDKEQDAKFQLTTFKQLKSGKYLLEGTFNASVFDNAEKPAKVENGYVRLILN